MRFSERQGLVGNDAEIAVRREAPHELRGVMIDIAREAGLSPSSLRPIVCRVRRVRANSNNWSEYPNIAGEVEELVDGAPWFEVYDLIEEIQADLGRSSGSRATYFEQEINKYFRKTGIGWQLVDGHIQVRGPEAFEVAVRHAQETLAESGWETAAREIHEALRDLSRRPDADLTGAIQHAMAALECTARLVCEDPRATLGELLKRQPDLFPPPLDQSVDKAWGYASERGRHLREGRDPAGEEAELIVGLSSVLVTYLVRKLRSR